MARKGHDPGRAGSRGSDGRHDESVIKHGRMAAQGMRKGDAEQARIGGRVVRHLTAKGNKDHPPTGGKKGKT